MTVLDSHKQQPDHQEVTVMSTPFPYILSETSLTFFVDGQSHQVLRSHPQFDTIVAAVEAGSTEAVELSKPIVKVMAALEEDAPESDMAALFRRTAGTLEVTEWGVSLDGNALHGHVIDRLMDVLRSGLDVTPWMRFVRKLYQNPSSQSRQELYGWLERSGMPITSDGDFLAYKRIRGNYRDIHSGTFDNSVGNVVEMSRTDVDDDRNRTCSTGLHFCSKNYLPNFRSTGNDDRVVIVKVNPADVVSIPSDYDDAKGRTWRYVVVGEMTLEEAGLHLWEPITDEYDSWDEDDEEVETLFSIFWNDEDEESGV